MRIFSRKDDVRDFNNEMLHRVCGTAVCTIQAEHNNPSQQKTKTGEAGGEYNTLTDHKSGKMKEREKKKANKHKHKQDCKNKLTQGLDARVMLTSNLNTACGLTNGTVGTLKELVFAENASPSELPIAAIVDFPHYRGTHGVSVDGKQCVPICPVERRFGGHNQHFRKQLPLALAWATTVHKSQGLTLDAIVLNLGPTEFCDGLTYVALSRVKKLSGIFWDSKADVTDHRLKLARVCHKGLDIVASLCT